MNLSPYYLAVEALGWCFITLVLTRAKAKPKCPATPKDTRILVALVLATLATICTAAMGSRMGSVLAFAGYSLTWLRFEARYDAKQALCDGTGRRLTRRGRA